jgi:hypothetical protein
VVFAWFCKTWNFSADVFLNCSFNYIGFILPPSQQNNSLRQQNSGNPIVIAILGTFSTVKIRRSINTSNMIQSNNAGSRIDVRPWLIK